MWSEFTEFTTHGSHEKVDFLTTVTDNKNVKRFSIHTAASFAFCSIK